MPNYMDLLNTPVDEVKKPELCPSGTYRGQLGKVVLGESREKKTPMVTFPVKLISPTDDVDAELAAERMDRIQKFTGKKDFFITEDARWRLAEFLKAVLGEEETRGQPMSVLLNDMEHKEVLVEVEHVPSRDNKDQIAVVKDILPLQ